MRGADGADLRHEVLPLWPPSFGMTLPRLLTSEQSQFDCLFFMLLLESIIDRDVAQHRPSWETQSPGRLGCHRYDNRC